jgi:hypothetical protein
MIGSREKSRAAIEAYLDANYPTMACLIAPQVNLPDSDQALDDELERYARLFISLRSDDAKPLEVTDGTLTEAA